MKLPKPLHAWQVSPTEAIAIQKKLAAMVRIKTLEPPIRYILGVDAAFSKGYTRCIAGAVLWDSKEHKVIAHYVADQAVVMPYIPGLLTFREGPALLAVLEKVQIVPDVMMCDGQGIAHPRGCGIASHLGLLTNIPSFGCGKSRLFGQYQEPGDRRGNEAPLYHPWTHERIGTVLRTKDRVKPVFISVGHNMDLATAQQLALSCTTRYRLPEPTRLADKLVAEAKKDF